MEKIVNREFISDLPWDSLVILLWKPTTTEDLPDNVTLDLSQSNSRAKSIVNAKIYVVLGGWLLVTNFLMDNSTPPSDWTAEQTYRGISNYTNNRMGITKGAMTQLRTHLGFSQLRFHCSKQQGRTFHVTTAANSSGEAVVQYFSGQTDVLPDSCGSFQRMDDDDSQLAVTCDRWGNEDGNHHVGKWGHYNKKGKYTDVRPRGICCFQVSLGNRWW